jgi:hypothetical protein
LRIALLRPGESSPFGPAKIGDALVAVSGGRRGSVEHARRRLGTATMTTSREREVRKEARSISAIDGRGR